MDGSEHSYLELRTGITEPVLRAVVELEGPGSRAVQVGWRSWLWQARTLGPQVAAWQPAVRLFLRGPVEELKVIATRCAFFNLPKSLLETFVKATGLDVDLSLQTFDIIFQIVVQVLKVSEEEALVVCQRRLAKPHDDEPTLDALMEVDEAVKVLDKHDFAKVADAQKAAEAKRADRHAYKHAYSERAKKVFGDGAHKKGAKKVFMYFFVGGSILAEPEVSEHAGWFRTIIRKRPACENTGAFEDGDPMPL